MSEALYIVIGLAIGVTVCVIFLKLRRPHEEALAQRILDQAQQAKSEEVAASIEQLKTAFSALSREALSSNTDDFLKLAKSRLEQQSQQGEQTLDEKKKLIDARLEEMGKKLGDLNTMIGTVEKQRSEAHGDLRGHLVKATQETHRLHETTAQLREALANPQRRGQWGERMAEDVLRLAGFMEGVNYRKQVVLGEGSRPDFTFTLPGDRLVHMDVKFPLVNYLKMLDAADDAARRACTVQFLRDVRMRVKEVTTREYIDPASGTVDYVLVFIPNEQVYGFIHEQDNSLLDEAMRSRVVLCSPMTLYAILAVIRQSVENFHLEQGAKQILELLAGFRKQWMKYAESMDAMGKRLKSAMDEYEQLCGVRTRQLQRQLDKIDDLQTSQEAREGAPLGAAPSGALPVPGEGGA